VLEDLLHYLRILYHTDYFHLSGTFRAGKGSYLVDLLDKASPISLVLIGGFLRLKYGGYKFIAGPFFSLAPRDVTVEAIVK
jgi:hypothetical protein